MFQHGQKVVCVDDRPATDGFPLPIVRGSIYTVARFETSLCLDGHQSVELVETTPPARPFFTRAFRATRFRPLNGRTDISALRALLEPLDA
jgi:hypothetical protein